MPTTPPSTPPSDWTHPGVVPPEPSGAQAPITTGVMYGAGGGNSMGPKISSMGSDNPDDTYVGGVLSEYGVPLGSRIRSTLYLKAVRLLRNTPYAVWALNARYRGPREVFKFLYEMDSVVAATTTMLLDSDSMDTESVASETALLVSEADATQILHVREQTRYLEYLRLRLNEGWWA